MILSENRCPPRIKCGAGFFRDHAVREGNMDEVIIVGAGIGGLTLGLTLHQAGIKCTIFESVPELRAIGVGINLLPHATRELAALGLEAELARLAIETGDAT